MGYIDFKMLKDVCEKYGLQTKTFSLFDKSGILEKMPSSWLQESIENAYIFPLISTQSQTERLVSPVLLEVGKHFKESVTLFSSEEDYDFCFLVEAKQAFIDAPICVIVVSKEGLMRAKVAQCAAQLYGAKLFNEAEGKNLPVLYGCATDGVEWQFMRFENDTFYIDNRIYTDLKEILGVWHYVISLYL